MNSLKEDLSKTLPFAELYFSNDPNLNSQNFQNAQNFQNHIHKNDCNRYCNKEEICLTCHNIIQCQRLTNCEMCGGYYGRPLHQPMSVGCLLIDCTNDIPVVWLINEKDKRDGKFKYNDIGGKFEANLDFNHIDTVIREVYEESGFIITLNNDPYVDVRTKQGLAYRCYIKATNQPIKINHVPTTTLIRMPLACLLNLINSNVIGSRLKNLFNKDVKNINKKIKLKELLETLI